MTKVFWVVAVAACSSSTSSTPSSSECDLSTDTGIDAAYNKATGKELPKRDRCVDRSQTFRDVVRIGMFANDRGCIPQGLLVGCDWNPPNLATAIMAKAGWARADAARRKELAIAWLAEIDGTNIVTTKPTKFSKEFTPPTVTADGSGLALEVWSVEPAGMEPITRYHKQRVRFGADGTPDAGQEIDKLEVGLHDE